MKNNKLIFYKTICIITSVVFIYSFSQHLFNSDSFLNGLGLTTSKATSFLAHRLSVFPIGLAVLLFLVRNLSHSKVRQYICISVGFVLSGYAGIGGYELFAGTVNKYILVPIIIEIILGFSFLTIFFGNVKFKIIRALFYILSDLILIRDKHEKISFSYIILANYNLSSICVYR